MEKEKLYFENEDAEFCHNLKHFIQEAEIENRTTISLHSAYPLKDESEYGWCMHYGTTIEKGDCGYECKAYLPVNGKSGKCKNKGILYGHGDIINFEKINNKWVEIMNCSSCGTSNNEETLFRTAPQGKKGTWICTNCMNNPQKTTEMTINIPDKFKTGTHFVRIDVSWGLILSSDYDRRFTYKRLNTKLKVICRRHGKLPENISSVTIIEA